MNDEARKRNGNLPGMGGVYNPVNLALYHYAGNNPVKYMDPDGKSPSDYFLLGPRLASAVIRFGLAQIGDVFRGGNNPQNIAFNDANFGIDVGNAYARIANAGPVLERGGAYGRLKNIPLLTQRHHLISQDAIKQAGGPLTTYSGPAILISESDHALLSSTGGSVEAGEYRAQQVDLLKAGKFLEAFDRDVADIRNQFGSKYDPQIKEAREYLQSILPTLQKELDNN